VAPEQRNSNLSPESAGAHRPAGRIKLEELLKGAQEIIIEHAGQDYRLRITSNGKLILTK